MTRSSCATNSMRNAQTPQDFCADLLRPDAPQQLVDALVAGAGSLDVLVNNASSFYPTPIGSITEDGVGRPGWQQPESTAVPVAGRGTAPQAKGGVIINIVDIHARRPLKDHVVYGPAKAGLEMLTRSLAKDLAPAIRVNGIAPGAILWPESGMTETVQNNILEQIPLGRPGSPGDIADCVLYLVRDASYVTGQIIAVDGGRSLGW